MKKKLFALLGLVSALSLSGCSFFNMLIPSNKQYDPWDGGKQALSYSQKDLRNNNYYTKYDSMPTTGNPKLLVIPIWFTNSNNFINATKKETLLTDLNNACFGNASNTGWHSISSYYKAESYGKCVIEGEVAPWYECGYACNNIDSNTTDTIVRNAVSNWKTNNPSKVSSFDSDHNGYLDGVLVIYGSPNYTNWNSYNPNSKSNMWAYTSWLETNANTSNPNPNVFIWASYDFMSADSQGGMTIDAHTYIHEMGHVFGLDDYYDYAYDGSTYDDNWSGGFSMQDYNVGGHDPYSILTFGWTDPYVPTKSASFTLRPFESSGEVILLSPDFSSYSPFDEYVLVEFYSPTGVNEHDTSYKYCKNKNLDYPQGPNIYGIRIWHVDSRLIKVKGDTYSIVNTFDTKEHSYLIGCSNTTYIEGSSAESNAHASPVEELRPYKLLELIRKGDYYGSRTEEYLANSDLFKAGDIFSLKSYSGYFRRNNKFNNGSRFSWNVRVDSISSTEAKVSVYQ